MSTESAFNSTGQCEGCLSNFSLFKRKKLCTVCKQDFCQACLIRSQSRTSSANERMCTTCQHLLTPSTSIDDILKVKTKHLRCYLTAKNISTQTCKEKRELAELIVKSRGRPIPVPPPRPQQQQNSNPEPQQQQRQSRNFNDTLHNFMSNVQDFVNISVNNAFHTNTAVPQPAPPQSNSQNNSRSRSNNSSTRASFSNGPPPPPPSQQQQSQSSSSSRAFSSSINDLFNIINENVPPVVQQTFTNNRFTFNNVFNSPQNSAQQQQQPQATSSESSSSETDDYEIINHPEPEHEPQAQTSRASSAANMHNGRASTASSSASASAPNFKRRASISDLKSENDIDCLNIKQMKEILASNFVEYKGCVERSDLVDRLKLLYRSHNQNRRMESELRSADAPEMAASNVYFDLDNNNHKSSDTSTATATAQDPLKPTEDDLCKICMDALIDCVLLECGHMVSCTKCGKRLAECPICRQNVVRVVRVFKP